MYRHALATLVFTGIAISNAACAQTIKPIKASASDLAGAIFARGDAAKQDAAPGHGADAVTFTSTDTAFQTGVYRSGPSHEEIAGPQGLPYNEFLYFLSGSVKLTSSDGSVMVVKTGEAVTLPKGWTGHFDTPGYTKLYATYNPDDAKPAPSASQPPAAAR
ncbi:MULTISPECIES: cupin domain-containing protein [Burkholderia cepacia complex]|uniref:Cupin n=1 Tax=Burkholderia anthina TaxID=179879 RepID=A0AAW3PVG1_9BURK|nr:MULTISPECIES: cupin domain-containing protein [Burkholderia cepacia complex]KVE07976.1 cupin [Burkholderia anthina]KWZ32946.1 cupin [Burkholderia anthina]MCA8033022.1 cupin domain-containing protein [Burkholderia arboris]